MSRTQIQTVIGLRLLSAFLITAMSAAVHEAAKSVPVGQIMFWRSVVALGPIDFTALVWAVVLDAVLFATLPTGLGWIGIAAITAAALFIALRPLASQ